MTSYYFLRHLCTENAFGYFIFQISGESYLYKGSQTNYIGTCHKDENDEYVYVSCLYGTFVTCCYSLLILIHFCFYNRLTRFCLYKYSVLVGCIRNRRRCSSTYGDYYLKTCSHSRLDISLVSFYGLYIAYTFRFYIRNNSYTYDKS